MITAWLVPFSELMNDITNLEAKVNAMTSANIDDMVTCVQSKVSAAAADSVRSILEESQALVQANANVAKIKETMANAGDTIGALATAVDIMAKGSSSSFGFVNQLVTNGGKIPEIFSQLSKFQELLDLQGELSSLGATMGQLQTETTDITDKFQTLENDGEQVAGCMSDAVRDVLTQVLELSNRVRDFRIRQLAIGGGLQTYNRWSDVAFQVPCTRTGQKCFTLAGDKQCVDYPEVYPCDYSAEVPFPNHHIPYVRFDFL